LTWLAAQAARVSRKSDLGIALAYMLKRQDGFRLFLDDGCVDIDSNLVENAIRRPAMNRRNALFAGHDEGGRNWARFNLPVLRARRTCPEAEFGDARTSARSWIRGKSNTAVRHRPSSGSPRQ
jgi:hypothetical protein